MYDQRTSLSDQVVDDVRRVLGEKVYTTIIPRNVRVAESPSHGKPVLLYDYRCSGSQAYIQARLGSDRARAADACGVIIYRRVNGEEARHGGRRAEDRDWDGGLRR